MLGGGNSWCVFSDGGVGKVYIKWIIIECILIVAMELQFCFIVDITTVFAFFVNIFINAETNTSPT